MFSINNNKKKNLHPKQSFCMSFCWRLMAQIKLNVTENRISLSNTNEKDMLLEQHCIQPEGQIQCNAFHQTRSELTPS